MPRCRSAGCRLLFPDQQDDVLADDRRTSKLLFQLAHDRNEPDALRAIGSQFLDHGLGIEVERQIHAVAWSQFVAATCEVVRDGASICSLEGRASRRVREHPLQSEECDGYKFGAVGNRSPEIK